MLFSIFLGSDAHCASKRSIKTGTWIHDPEHRVESGVKMEGMLSIS